MDVGVSMDLWSYHNCQRKTKQNKESLILKQILISPRIELGTFCVLSRCHNQLDHETK